MSKESTAFQEVVRFCLGSVGYRCERIGAFIGAVEALPTEPLTTLLGKAHLAGLFKSVVARHELRTRRLQAAITRMVPVLRARAIFNRNIHAELLNLGSKLAVADGRVRPVVLKGIACWDTYYDDPIARRVRDLDLLIESPDQADIICDVLEEEGYEALFFVDDKRTVREHFRSGESYSVPPLRIRRRADIEDDDEVGDFRELEDVVRRHGGDTGLELVDDLGPILTVDVELHRALFATTEGTFVGSEPSDYRLSATLPQFREMTTGAALAYTGVKLALDILETLSCGENNVKCLKLAADFVRILEKSGQRDFEEAIVVARRWNCLHHFADTLQAVRVLTPEVALHGLPAPDGNDSLDLLLDVAADALEGTLPCSA
ncbi:nucleotidyltransferase family protein [Dokdonella soli]|uniref:Nucleotidyltransferase family protein n=1 Tax=Dokdonella soli TaxID=529810 RepID=A0ABN1IHQ5_9GAMM